jgi:hypothetical protein
LEQQNRDRQDLTCITHAHARELALESDLTRPSCSRRIRISPGVVGGGAVTDEFYRPRSSPGAAGDTQGSRAHPELHITVPLTSIRVY